MKKNDSGRHGRRDVLHCSLYGFRRRGCRYEQTVMWIDGYMSGKSDNTMMDNAWMEKLGTHMGKYCASNPQKTIMDAIENMPE